jgi:hypothetical protein
MDEKMKELMIDRGFKQTVEDSKKLIKRDTQYIIFLHYTNYTTKIKDNRSNMMKVTL